MVLVEVFLLVVLVGFYTVLDDICIYLLMTYQRKLMNMSIAWAVVMRTSFKPKTNNE